MSERATYNHDEEEYLRRIEQLSGHDVHLYTFNSTAEATREVKYGAILLSSSESEAMLSQINTERYAAWCIDLEKAFFLHDLCRPQPSVLYSLPYEVLVMHPRFVVADNRLDALEQAIEQFEIPTDFDTEQAESAWADNPLPPFVI